MANDQRPKSQEFNLYALLYVSLPITLEIDPCSFLAFLLPVEEVKNRWRSCRDQFRKEMRKQGLSGAGLHKKRPYLFREQLMFLRAVMDLRPTEDNLEEEGEESAPQLSSACEEETTAGQQETVPGPTPAPSEPPAASGADSPPPPLALPIRSRRRANPPAESNVNVQVLDYLSRARQEDHHDMFARSLAHYMRQLPPERLLRTRTSVEIVLELANSLPDPSVMHDALENLRRYGQLIDFSFSQCSSSQVNTKFNFSKQSVKMAEKIHRSLESCYDIGETKRHM
ncbi:uncharacterized protein LOC122931554 [Bufo gargarizans]|uniref:uncharacterized protein LOC122931554 n=1 Tax=Bufo gargarizans TaxID=30331 RepID=UPI001CF4939F|nr:uncharacterized protein LOC122931554 [Bufo gargarizans]